METSRDRRSLTKIGNKTELAVYLVTLSVAIASLVEAASLDFYRQHTLGPAVYPSVVLAILIITAIILIVGAVRARVVTIYSSFPSGAAEHRFLERFLSTLSIDDVDEIKIVTQVGEGRFSCFQKAARAPADGYFAAVLTSEVGAVGNHYAAQIAMKQFDVVGGLFFEPDALVVSASSSSKTIEELQRVSHERPLMIALTQKIGLDRGIDDWLGSMGIQNAELDFEEDPEHVLAAVQAGKVDAAIVPRMALAETNSDAFHCLYVADIGAADAGEPRRSSPDFVSGTWAAIALPKGADAQVVSRWEADLDNAGKQLDVDGEIDELGYSQVVPPNRAFLSLLEKQCMQCDPYTLVQKEHTASRGKFLGLMIALLACAAFSPAMSAFGFAPTATAFLIILIAVLWPSYRHRIWALVLPLGIVLALALHWLFAGVFYIRFPIGQITGV